MDLDLTWQPWSAPFQRPPDAHRPHRRPGARPHVSTRVDSRWTLGNHPASPWPHNLLHRPVPGRPFLLGNTTTTNNNATVDMVKKAAGKRVAVNPFAGKYVETYSSFTRLPADSNLTALPPLKTEIQRGKATQAAYPWSYENLEKDNSPFWTTLSSHVYLQYGSLYTTTTASGTGGTSNPSFSGDPRFQSFVRIHDSTTLTTTATSVDWLVAQ